MPLPLSGSDPGDDEVGEFRFLGGWELVSEDRTFGGISGLVVRGSEFIAIGDAGGVFHFTMGETGEISNARITTLPDGPVRPDGGEPGKLERDAESVIYDPESDRYWIGFERAHEIWRYTADLASSEAGTDPRPMAAWPSNGGAEAMVRGPDGSFLVFSEAAQGPEGSTEALLFRTDPSDQPKDTDGSTPAVVRFFYRPPDGYRVTDAASLSDGRALLLNRRFSVPRGLSAIVTVVDVDRVDGGQIIEGRPIAQLDAPLAIDNMEAIAVQEERGATVVWLASDDNFNPLQRTLLLKFEWPQSASAPHEAEEADEQLYAVPDRDRTIALTLSIDNGLWLQIRGDGRHSIGFGALPQTVPVKPAQFDLGTVYDSVAVHATFSLSGAPLPRSESTERFTVLFHTLDPERLGIPYLLPDEVQRYVRGLLKAAYENRNPTQSFLGDPAMIERIWEDQCARYGGCP